MNRWEPPSVSQQSWVDENIQQSVDSCKSMTLSRQSMIFRDWFNWGRSHVEVGHHYKQSESIASSGVENIDFPIKILSTVLITLSPRINSFSFEILNSILNTLSPSIRVCLIYWCDPLSSFFLLYCIHVCSKAHRERIAIFYYVMTLKSFANDHL